MPLRSMTGFGSAEGGAAGGRLRIELKSVNHRHLSVQLKLPGELGPLEADVRERLRTHLERGHVSVSARWVEDPAQAASVKVDEARAKAVVEGLRKVAKKLKIKGDVDLATLARIPDVVQVTADEATLEPGPVLKVLDQAAKALVVMREREGKALGDDLAARVRLLEQLAKKVEARAPQRITAERDRLAAAVKEISQGVAIDPARLAQEIAIQADRLDVTEEIVRFTAHLAAVKETLKKSDGGAGKQLSFILQELGREANTIGSKANDAPMAEAVIAMKGELERMREQVENLE